MKKVALALLLVIAMLCCVITAGASIPDRFVPATVDEVPYLPSVPQVPTYTLTTVDDHYVLETDWEPVLVGEPLIIMLADGGLSGTVEFSFDSSLGAWISDTILPENDRNLLTFWDGYQGDTYTQVYIYANSGEIRNITCRTQVGEESGDDYEYDWDADLNLTSWTDYEGASVSCQFDNNGNITYYAYTADDGANVNYNSDGVLWSLSLTRGDTSYMYFHSDAIGSGSQAGWNIVDLATWTFTPCDIPDGVDMADYPPLLNTPPVVTPTPEPTEVPTAEPTTEPTEAPTAKPTPDVTWFFDDNGNASHYQYTADDGTLVNYNVDGSFKYINAIYNDNEYIYFESTGWLIYDSATDKYVSCDEPEGIKDAYPPILVVTPPAVTPTPTTEPTAAPTAEPTTEPTEIPTSEPTAEPTAAPTAEPTAEPTEVPTAEPTAEPTEAPTAEPTAEPTEAPTAEPTAEPTVEPTPAPTEQPTEEPTATPEPTPEPTPDVVWYGNNTVGLAGISLRDTYEGLTDKWYNVVPVDLTQDGVQTFTLVASNLFYIGEAAVVVEGDNITVYYTLADGHGYVKGECLQWFTAASDITADFLEAPASDLAFGVPISRAEVLDNADVGILFICNRVTYRQPYKGTEGYLTRYWPNKPEWKAFREQLMTIMPE